MLKATATRQIPRFSSQNLQLFSPSKVGFTAHEGHNSTFLGPNAFEIRATHRVYETNIAGSWQIFGSHMITKTGELRTPQLLWRFSSFRWQTLHGTSTSFPRLLTCNQSSACAEPSHRAWSVIEPAMERLTDQGWRLFATRNWKNTSDATLLHPRKWTNVPQQNCHFVFQPLVLKDTLVFSFGNFFCHHYASLKSNLSNRRLFTCFH